MVHEIILENILNVTVELTLQGALCYVHDDYSCLTRCFLVGQSTATERLSNRLLPCYPLCFNLRNKNVNTSFSPPSLLSP